MAYYLNEVPTGDVDGVNTVFETANNIFTLVAVFVDGVVYTGDITFDENEITLDDAPTSSIFVDYYDSAPGPGDSDFNLQSVYDAYALQKKDISDVPVETFIMWCNWIQRFAYRKIKNVDPEQFYSEATVTAQQGNNVEITLPDSFRDLSGYNAGLWYLNSDGLLTGVQLPKTGYASTSVGYYLHKNKIYFTPVQWGASQSFKLRWIPTLTTFTSLSDCWTINATNIGTPVVREEWTEYLTKAIDVLYTQWDDDPGSESSADQRFVRCLNEMLSNIQRSPIYYDQSNYAAGF